MRGAGLQLIEREHELTSLWDAFRGARSGRGGIVLVSGEAGVGKSSLVRAFCDEVATRARTAWGGCDPLITPRPLGPVIDIARHVGGPLGDLARAGGPAEPLFDAFLALMVERPVAAVVVVEDLHWVDAATLDLLRFVARRIDDTNGLVILTYRDDEIGRDHPFRSLLGDLATSPAVHRLPLRPLTPDAVGTLAAERGVDAADLHAVTGGNPFFVTEILAAEQGADLPGTVRDAVLARAARLPPAARLALDVVALARAPVPTTMVLDVGAAGGPVSGDATVTSAAVDAAVDAGMLVADRDGLAFRHELARRTVDDDVPPGRRTALHRHILGWLVAQPSPDASEVAYHAEAARDGALALEYGVTAAVQAAALGSHREAAAQYARALRWAKGLPARETAELLERHSIEAHLADDIATAVEQRAAAVELRRAMDDRRGLGDSLRWFSRVLWVAGRNTEAQDAGREALAILEDAGPSRELAMAHSNLAQLAMLDRDVDGALHHGERAIELAEEFEDTETLVHALNNVGSAQYLGGQPATGRVKIERSLALARAEGLHDHAARALCNLGSGTGELREYDDAEHFLDRGIVFCADHQQDYFGHYLQAWRARCHFEQGRWAEAEEEAAQVGARPGVAAVTRIVVLTVLGRLAVRRGDPTGQEQLTEAWELAAVTDDLQRVWPVAAGRAEAAWLRGDPGAVSAIAGGAYADALASAHSWAAGELGFWLHRCGHLDRLPDVAAAPYRLQAHGDPMAAAAAWRELGCDYEVALSLADADGEAALREAFEIACRLRAGPLTDLIAQRLRERGIRGLQREPRQPTAEHPAGLTRRQAEVLELIVEGLRDAEIAERLFISTKTAGHHVSAILAKLGVNSRAAAIAEAHRLSLVRDPSAR